MLDRGVLLKMKKYDDYTFPFLKIADYLKSADIVFGNLESKISDKGIDQGGIYSFRAPVEVIEGLVFAGFDVLSIANNHSFDWGVNALVDTKNRLKNVGIIPVGGGIDAYLPIFYEINGKNIAFLAYTAVGASGWAPTQSVPGVAWYTDEKMKTGISLAQEKNPDLIVMSIHFGDEYQKYPNQEQIRIARMAIDNGVNLVIGHHPHVIQPVEKYKNGIIAYSLGNFIFDQGFSEETMEALLLEVLLKKDGSLEYKEKVFKLNEDFQIDSILK